MKYIKYFEAVEEPKKLTSEEIVYYNKHLFIKNSVDGDILVNAILDDFIDIEDAKELTPKVNANTISNLKLYQLGVFTKEDVAKQDSDLIYKNDELYISLDLDDLEHFTKDTDWKQVKSSIYYEDEGEIANNNWGYYYEDWKIYFGYDWHEFSKEVLAQIKENMVSVKLDLGDETYVIKEADFIDDDKMYINGEEYDIEDVITEWHDDFDDCIIRPFVDAYSEAKASADATDAFDSVMDQIEKVLGPFERTADDDFVFNISKMTMDWKALLAAFEEDNSEYDNGVVTGIRYLDDHYGGYKNALYEFGSREDLIEYDIPNYGWDGDIDYQLFNEIFLDRLNSY